MTNGDEAYHHNLGMTFVASELSRFFERCELAQAAGGVSLRAVMDHTATVPDGWTLDPETYFYLPPGFVFEAGHA